jgi:sec-independent protein translocase protein TatA
MGLGELVFIFLVVLLFFGGSKLPGIGAGLGKAARGFKDAFRSGAQPGAREPPPPRELPRDEPKP